MYQEELTLPISHDEPKPWVVRTWRYHSHNDEYYLTKEDAWDACVSRIQAELDEWVEGVFDPDGKFFGRPE